MKAIHWLVVLGLVCWAAPASFAAGHSKSNLLECANQRLHGTVVDYTHNHGSDRRIWSPALKQRRDLYVYLPPGFDPGLCYPLILYLHAFTKDETSFLENEVFLFDEAMATGKLPPALIAVPDGSIQGRPTFLYSASFFLNSNAGRFEDFLMQDVWDFVLGRYPIRPEREAHILVGASMGGSAAYRLAITHPERFKVVVGMLPAVNLRWVDCHGRYRSKFDPCCWGWRTEMHPHEVIGVFHQVIAVRFKHLFNPLFGDGPEALQKMIEANPIELLDARDVRPGLLDMFIGYAGKDEFHIDAQVESFLYRAKQRGLTVEVVYDPEGHHRTATGLKMFPDAIKWLAPRMAPYSPPLPPANLLPPQHPEPVQVPGN
jgi:pimeloyl-ACP methyl ester carboxylesterase